jgi:hypothetical protein
MDAIVSKIVYQLESADLGSKIHSLRLVKDFVEDSGFRLHYFFRCGLSAMRITYLEKHRVKILVEIKLYSERRMC